MYGVQTNIAVARAVIKRMIWKLPFESTRAKNAQGLMLDASNYFLLIFSKWNLLQTVARRSRDEETLCLLRGEFNKHTLFYAQSKHLMKLEALFKSLNT